MVYRLLFITNYLQSNNVLWHHSWEPHRKGNQDKFRLRGGDDTLLGAMRIIEKFRKAEHRPHVAQIQANYIYNQEQE